MLLNGEFWMNIVEKLNKVIISGATGMLGLALVRKCIAQDTAVVALIQNNSRRKHLLPEHDRLSTIECDLAEYQNFAKIPQDSYDVFFHFAWDGVCGDVRNSVVRQNENVVHTIGALHLASRLRAKRFVGVGSQAEYGPVQGIVPEGRKVSPASAYGVAKYAAGRFCSILADQLGIEFIWTRVFSTYGINDMDSTMIMYCVNALLRKEKPVLTKCGQMWDYLNCDDAANAYYLLGSNGVPGKTYNIGSGEARPLSEYVMVIRDSIDRSLDLGMGEKEYGPDQIMYLCADISELTQDTGFVPRIVFEDGIRETIEWVKRERGVVMK
jgi:nucleoside-diphosphate-sugar epimerase